MDASKGDFPQHQRHQSEVKTGDVVEKNWGSEKIIYVEEVAGAPELTRMNKELCMRRGEMCSVQFHEIKRERVKGQKGAVEVVFFKPSFLEAAQTIPQDKAHVPNIQQWVARVVVLRSEEDIIQIHPGEIHCMRAVDADCVYEEESVGPNETTRVWDPYKSLREGQDRAQ